MATAVLTSARRSHAEHSVATAQDIVARRAATLASMKAAGYKAATKQAAVALADAKAELAYWQAQV